jgi:hypothetical protein
MEYALKIPNSVGRQTFEYGITGCLVYCGAKATDNKIALFKTVRYKISNIFLLSNLLPFGINWVLVSMSCNTHGQNH